MTRKLESSLIGRDLSLQDNEFVECVVYDVQFFVKNCNDNSSKSVLVFPPVNNYRRFLIHKVVEEQSQDLSTFSIGQGHARRTVVCFKRHVIKKPALQNESERALTTAMGVDLDGSANNTTLSHETATKRAKATPAMGIYRPPAARKLEEQVLTSPIPAPPPDKPRSGKARRPDIQVYVPRAKRMEVNRKCSLGLSRSSEESEDSKSPCNELSENKKNQRNSRGNRLSLISTESYNSSPPSNNKRKPEPSKRLADAGKPEEKPSEVNVVSVDVHVGKKVKQDDVTDKIHTSAFITNPEPVDTSTEEEDIKTETATARKQMPERKFLSDVLIISDAEPVERNEPSGKKLSSDSLMFSDSESVDKEELSAKELSADSLMFSDSESVDKEEPSAKELSADSLMLSDSESVDKEEPSANELSADSLILSDSEPADNNIGKQESSVKKVPSNVLIISDLAVDKQERSGKMVQSNVLMISDLEPSNSTSTKQSSSVEKSVVTSNKPARQVMQKNCKKTEQQKQAKERGVPLNLNPDECTWDMLFDENGDCLDPRLMEELTSAVGSVTIEKPKSDYRSYQSRVEMMLSGNAEDEFAHVLEIYNFPPEFKTQDLFTVFSPYMKNGFEIKWVDDTHALGVFSSALIAAEVLAADHPFVKTRPLHQATPESRLKARRSAEFLQPYRARPETCAAMARRLVTGALGVRLRTSAEEREAERRLLREARERKRLAARQRDEAWEGTLMSNK